MNPAVHFFGKAETSQLPIARLDGLEEESLFPFREYLQLHGCLAVINEAPPVAPLYHIVLGDPRFVEKIFAESGHEPTKRIALLYVANEDEALALSRRVKSKIVLSPPKALGARELDTFFAYFFTSNELIFDMRDGSELQETHTQHQAPAESEARPDIFEDRVIPLATKIFTDTASSVLLLAQSDKKRIAETIASLYEPQRPSSQTKRRRRIKRPLWFSMLIGMVILLFPVVSYGASFAIAAGALVVGEDSFKSGNFRIAGIATRISRYWIRQADFALHTIAIPWSLFGRTEFIHSQEQLLSVMENIAFSESHIERVVSDGQSLALQMTASLGGQKRSGESSVVLVERMRNDIYAIQNNLGLAQAQLQSLTANRVFPFSFRRVQSYGTRATARLEAVRSGFTMLDHVLAIYPGLSGVKQKQTYLILLQNSMELRPTGGFIGTIARATFEDGKLSDLGIQDVYAVDGQLKGHVDPPRPIRDVLHQEHWYLRDSNWDPDFRVAGARAAWFYEKETGEHVDGVFAVNSSLFIDFLRVTGPITLRDYNDQITAENFFGKSLFYTQADFFPGSTQKSDFLGSLMREMIGVLAQERRVTPSVLLSAVSDGLERHDLLFFFMDPSLEQAIERFGWAGNTEPPTCSGVAPVRCFPDWIEPVEANLGVNKVNYFMKRSSIQIVTIGSDGTVNEEISLLYKNTATDTSLSGGSLYRTYLRLLLPSDVTVSDVSLDGIRVPLRDTKKLSPALPFVETTEVSTKEAVIGIAFEVAPGAERRLSIAYRRAAKWKAQDMYRFARPKQPGITEDKTEVLVNFPVYWTPVESGDWFLANEGQVKYNSPVSEDIQIQLQFQK